MLDTARVRYLWYQGSCIVASQLRQKRPPANVPSGVSSHALSKNPDAVDSMLDLLDNIKKELDIMRHETEMIEFAQRTAPIAIRSKETDSTMLTIQLLNMTAVRLQSDLAGYDAFKDWLLENMHLRIRALDPLLVYDADQMADPDHIDEYTSSRPLLTIVSEDLSHFIMGIERIGTYINLLDMSWGQLLNQRKLRFTLSQTPRLLLIMMVLRRKQDPRKSRLLRSSSRRYSRDSYSGPCPRIPFLASIQGPNK